MQDVTDPTAQDSKQNAGGHSAQEAPVTGEARPAPLLRVVRMQRDPAATAENLREIHEGIAQEQGNVQHILSGLASHAPPGPKAHAPPRPSPARQPPSSP